MFSRTFIFASILLIATCSIASAQPQVYGGAYGGAWMPSPTYLAPYPESGSYWSAGVGFGYSRGWYGGIPPYAGSFWTNGLSLYGPPVPTMAPTPGAFGGSDAHRLFFDNPPPANGVFFGITSPPRGLPTSVLVPMPLEMSDVRAIPAPQATKPDGKTCLRLTINFPVEDADLWIDNQRVPGTGRERVIDQPAESDAQVRKHMVIARWKESGKDRAESREVLGTPGQTLLVTFGK